MIPPKSLILVENLDRISRQTARKALRVIESIVDKGVSVVTLNDGREYTSASLDDDPLNLLMALVTFIRANEESATKSRRIEASWKRRRALAPERPMTSICPYWTKLTDDRASFELIPDRAAVVRRIFSDAFSGLGALTISRGLNAEKVPPFSLGRRQALMWYACNISLMLTNTSAIGTFTPHRIERVNGKKHRLAFAPIPGYYPPVVSPEVFKRVGELRKAANNRLNRKSPYPLTNITGRLLRCSSCGGAVSRASKSEHGEYFACMAALMGFGCQRKSVRYAEVEQSVIGFFKTQIQQNCLTSFPTARRPIAELNCVLHADELDRPRANKLLRSLLTSIEVFASSGVLRFHWRHGGSIRLQNAFTLLKPMAPRPRKTALPTC